MNDTISEPRQELKDHAPRTQIVRVKQEMIGAIIGQGGKVIQEMQRVTNTTIVIEEVKGEGVVSIFATSQTDMDAALAYIEELTAEPEVGKVYTGKVKSIMPFGAFIEFMKGRDGLLHISEIRWERVENMDGVLEEGEEVQVKLVEVDRQGKCRLSRKVLLPKPEGYVERPPRTRDNNRGGDRGGRRDDRGGRRDDRRRRD